LYSARERIPSRELRRYPQVKATTDYHDLLTDPAIDAIAIATPVSTHFDLAMQALHVPVSMSSLKSLLRQHQNKVSAC
jgi:predicted dehydrogenase